MVQVETGGLWEKKESAFFDILDTKADLSYRMHENEMKRMYNQRVTDI